MIRGHALWLLPEEAVSTRVAAVIDHLARTRGGPRFLPHVTVVAGLDRPPAELRTRMRALARTLPALAVTLGRAAARAEHYRALFVEIESGDLRALHVRAAAALGLAADPAYLPHLSLAYGDFPPAAKEAMLDRVGRRWGERCVLDRLAVVPLAGSPESWTPIATERLVAAPVR
jgi:2'-5' RNA ligase